MIDLVQEVKLIMKKDKISASDACDKVCEHYKLDLNEYEDLIDECFQIGLLP
jgi:hypothetical protein